MNDSTREGNPIVVAGGVLVAVVVVIGMILTHPWTCHRSTATPVASVAGNWQRRRGHCP
ncbi:MAG: hypothetical protein ACYCW6_26830 [Candidatus Xenobia bacterium]